jgi:beta-barrel assembly-enhancing protease
MARFYDGLSAEATEVGARWGDGELLIYRPGDFSIVARWRREDLAVLGDTEHEAVPLVVCKGSEARLVVEDTELRRYLGAEPRLAALVAPRPHTTRRIAQFGATLAGLVAVFWGVVQFGSEYAAPYVPNNLQAKLGREVRDELVAGRILCKGKAGLEAVNGLANRLARAGGYAQRITVEIIKGGPVNAFTLPGGIMILYSDLIADAADGEEVAGVIAHEVGHTVNYHPIKGVAREFGLDLLLKQLTGGYSDLSTLESGGGLLVAFKNGRTFEREADATGIRLLEKLGLRADGMSRFFQKLLDRQPGDPAKALGIWSDHPPTTERIAATKRTAAGKPAFSEQQWQELRKVCD